MKARIAQQKPEEILDRTLSNGRSKSRHGTQQKVATDALVHNQNIMLTLNEMQLLQGKQS
jgi:hypothetical protein